MRWAGAALVPAAAAAVLTGCGGDAGAAPGAAPGATAAPTEREVVVLAAASLTDVFTALGEDFEAANPGTAVTFSFAGSASLAAQAVQGAPADVFAAASPATMATAVDGGAVAGEPQVFTANVPQIAVPAGNPAGVDGPEDLADPALRIALCDEQVPCGAAASRALEAAGVVPAPDTLEQDVRDVLGKVRLGEVDAGVVYRTDVLAAGDAVEGVDLPTAAEGVTEYTVAVLERSPEPEAARAFVELVRSERGRAQLAEAGFTAPPAG